MATKRRLGEGRNLLADEYGEFFVSTINMAGPMSGERMSPEKLKERYDGYGGVVYETMAFQASKTRPPKTVYHNRSSTIEGAIENHEAAVQFLVKEFGIDRSTGTRSGE